MNFNGYGCISLPTPPAFSAWYSVINIKVLSTWYGYFLSKRGISLRTTFTKARMSQDHNETKTNRLVSWGPSWMCIFQRDSMSSSHFLYFNTLVLQRDISSFNTYSTLALLCFDIPSLSLCLTLLPSSPLSCFKLILFNEFCDINRPYLCETSKWCDMCCNVYVSH